MPDRTLFTIGARPDDTGVAFSVWAPSHERVELVLEAPAGTTSGTGLPFLAKAILDAGTGEARRHADDRRAIAMTRDERGYWHTYVAGLTAGALYRYRLDGDNSKVFPDPASRFQPHGVHGPSQVIDPTAYRWQDEGWRAPSLDALTIYELHLGTFTPEGTCRAAAGKLPYLRDLGVSAIELMPVADFPGDRNWGYDGVALFAPARCYGTPDDLRTLVDAAHAHGLAVVLDVVYNHFGPDGAYANAFSSYYFTDRHRSPWGDGVNLDGPHSAEVRAFFIQNALQWAIDFHVDALRLDATHALQDDSRRHFLAELTATVRERAPRPVLFIAEDHRNLVTLLQPETEGGWGVDAVWADDFHHQVRVHTARDHEGYYADFTGSTKDLATTIQQGWFFTGQHSRHMKEARGTDPSPLRPPQFVVCIQNHDQTGNRADGARLNHDIDPAAYRAASVLLLAAPETPLLFMGQEWAAGTPFLYFTDHNDQLGRLVTQGRREEFGAFAAFADPARRAAIPDPQAEETFDMSRLQWQEVERPPHRHTLALYRALLALRRSSPALRASARDATRAWAVDDGTIAIARTAVEETLIVVVRLSGSGGVTVADAGAGPFEVRLTTEEAAFSPDPNPIAVSAHGSLRVEFVRPGAVVVGTRLAPQR